MQQIKEEEIFLKKALKIALKKKWCIQELSRLLIIIKIINNPSYNFLIIITGDNNHETILHIT